MKTKLLRKWIKVASRYYNSLHEPFPLQMLSDGKGHSELQRNSSEKWIAKHEIALGCYKYIPWKEFAYKYRKYSRKYWTPEAIIRRTLNGEKE